MPDPAPEPYSSSSLIVVPCVLGWSNPGTGPHNNRLYATDHNDSPRWATPERVPEAALTEAGAHEGDRVLVLRLGNRFTDSQAVALYTGMVRSAWERLTGTVLGFGDRAGVVREALAPLLATITTTTDRDDGLAVDALVPTVLALIEAHCCSTEVILRARAERAEATLETATSGRAPRGDLKGLREELCRRGTQSGWPEDVQAAVWAVVDLIDTHRPLAANGKHGNLHTPTCGCEGAEPAQETGDGAAPPDPEGTPRG